MLFIFTLIYSVNLQNQVEIKLKNLKINISYENANTLQNSIEIIDKNSILMKSLITLKP